MAFGMLKVYDPANLAIQNSAAQLRTQDESERMKRAGALVDFFDGNHRAYQEAYLAEIITDPTTLKNYQRHSRQANITRLIVNRLAIGGERPLRVTWADENGNEESEDALKASLLWEQIAHRDNKFDAFVKTVYQRTALTKTVVAAVTWDPYHGKVMFKHYTPNHVDVRRVEQNPDPARPDAYRILESEGMTGGQGEVWRYYDFSDRGPVAWTWTSGSRTAWDRGQNKNATPMDMVDPDTVDAAPAETVEGGEPVKTGRALVPFVTFRTALPSHSFFVDDGQDDLYETQLFVNQLWSQISIALWYLSSAIAVLEGSGWEGNDSGPVRIPIDPSIAIKRNISPLDGSSPGGLSFVNPSNAENIAQLLNVIQTQVAMAAAAQGISPDAVTVSSSVQSGVSLWIQGQEIRRWHNAFANISQASWEEFVRVARVTWDAQNPTDPFPAGVTHTVEMGEYRPSLSPEDELKNDKSRLDMGIDTLEDLIRKHHPELDDKEIQARIAPEEEAAPVVVEETPLQVAQRLQILVSTGVLSKDEARKNLDPTLPKMDGGSKATPEIQRAVLEAGVLTVNEVRATYGFPPLPGEAGTKFVTLADPNATPAPPEQPTQKPDVRDERPPVSRLFGSRPPVAGTETKGQKGTK